MKLRLFRRYTSQTDRRRPTPAPATPTTRPMRPAPTPDAAPRMYSLLLPPAFTDRR